MFERDQVLAANIDTSNEPRLHGKIPRSVVVEVGGQKIGIIGYLTTETSVQRADDSFPAHRLMIVPLICLVHLESGENRNP